MADGDELHMYGDDYSDTEGEEEDLHMADDDDDNGDMHLHEDEEADHHEGEEQDMEGDLASHANTLSGLLARLSGGLTASSLLGEMGAGGRYRRLLDNLQSGNETALKEVVEMLLMGNEESLAGFRCEPFVSALHNLLNAEEQPHVVC